jgi:hypothetical protein
MGVSPSSVLTDRFSLDCTSLSLIKALMVKPTEDAAGLGGGKRIGVRRMTAELGAGNKGRGNTEGAAAAACWMGSAEET